MVTVQNNLQYSVWTAKNEKTIYSTNNNYANHH